VNHDLVRYVRDCANKLRYFTPAEVLLMAAMNQVEAKRKPAAMPNSCEQIHLKLAMITNEDQDIEAVGRPWKSCGGTR
jgi:hypothetical protein